MFGTASSCDVCICKYVVHCKGLPLPLTVGEMWVRKLKTLALSSGLLCTMFVLLNTRVMIERKWG